MIKERIVKAYNFSQERHKGQMRKNSDLEYFTHPKYVARIVEEFTEDETLIISAFLHDLLEDTPTTEDEITEIFGADVASMVRELTNDSVERGSMKKKEYILYKMSNMSDSALTIKLADRFHNILFLEADSDGAEEFLKYYYKNTRFIMDHIKERRLDEGNNFNHIHLKLIDRINTVLDFLKIRYNL